MIETKKLDASGAWYKTAAGVAYPMEDPTTLQRINLGVVTKVTESTWVLLQASEGVLIKTNEDGEPVEPTKKAAPEAKAETKAEEKKVEPPAATPAAKA